MTDKYPPLPEIEISESTKRYTDQQTVDTAMRIIYERRPDLFTKLAERDRTETDPNDAVKKDFYDFILKEVKKEVKIPSLNVRTAIAREARLRARKMYGMPI